MFNSFRYGTYWFLKEGMEMKDYKSSFTLGDWFFGIMGAGIAVCFIYLLIS